MRTRIDRLAQLKKMEEDGTFAMLPKKEVIKHQGEIAKLEKYLGGVKDMKKLPGALFIVDPRKERNAIAEARKLHIPIVAIVDTNCDPDEVDYVIPGNDDAIRAIRLIAATMANAVSGRPSGRRRNTEAPAAEAEPLPPRNNCTIEKRPPRDGRSFQIAVPLFQINRRIITMAFTAADVKKLREMTNVGMMDCKKALTETDGDMDKAVEWLREKGLAKAAKKAGRIAAEGMAYATVCDKCGVGAVVEVNCETDFCAKTDPFVDFVKDICQVVTQRQPRRR